MAAKKIRTASRAIIIKNQSLLVLRRTGLQGEFYVLPGGGQMHEEAIQQTLIREVLEEVNLHVNPEHLLFINEFIGKRDSRFPHHEQDVHQIDFTFLCSMSNEQEAQVGAQPDVHQIGIAWIPLEEITDYRMHPKDDLNFIMGAPGRDALASWIQNGFEKNTLFL
ncbi:NUDIX domain-containing protein [Paenibacillus sp. UNC451MF]|uniref:NUDIX domain-containing protein n=1 Tax=Paenibacillus sp. UNC451MF TaxID=1449063 RepID=UPI00068B303C|nr:NUDIX domain-containing protein [Paenibacillus sp. UNC451MF]